MLHKRQNRHQSSRLILDFQRQLQLQDAWCRLTARLAPSLSVKLSTSCCWPACGGANLSAPKTDKLQQQRPPNPPNRSSTRPPSNSCLTSFLLLPQTYHTLFPRSKHPLVLQFLRCQPRPTVTSYRCHHQPGSAAIESATPTYDPTFCQQSRCNETCSQKFIRDWGSAGTGPNEIPIASGTCGASGLQMYYTCCWQTCTMDSDCPLGSYCSSTRTRYCFTSVPTPPSPPPPAPSPPPPMRSSPPPHPPPPPTPSPLTSGSSPSPPPLTPSSNALADSGTLLLQLHGCCQDRTTYLFVDMQQALCQLWVPCMQHHQAHKLAVLRET